MKIVVVTPSISYTGVSKVAVKQAKALRDLGHDVKVISILSMEPPKDLIEGLEECVHIRRDIRFPILSRTLNMMLWKWRFPRVEEADAVIAHNYATALAGKLIAERTNSLFGILVYDLGTIGYSYPVLITLRYYPYLRRRIPVAFFLQDPAQILKNPHSIRSRFCRSIERKLSCSTDVLMAQSNLVADIVKGLYGIRPVTVHLGCDPVPSIPERRGDYVLIATRLHPAKEFTNAFIVCRKAKARLVLAGAWCPETPEVLASLEVYGPRDAEVVMNPSEKRLTELYLNARCYLLTHLEPFGLNALEAASCGCPIIIPRPSGVTELFQDGRHGFFPNFNAGPNEYARLVKRLMKDERLAWKMGREAWERSKRNTWLNHAKKVAGLFESASSA